MICRSSPGWVAAGGGRTGQPAWVASVGFTSTGTDSFWPEKEGWAKSGVERFACYSSHGTDRFLAWKERMNRSRDKGRTGQLARISSWFYKHRDKVFGPKRKIRNEGNEG